MTGEHEPQRLPAYAQLQLPRKPPSPPAQHLPSPLNQPSPSTVQESPQQTPRPFDASGSAESTARKGMRSQIACARCRRSKTKCENTGQGTVCKACANTNRKCEWDHTAAVPSSTGSLRRDSTADDAQPKKRRKVLPTTSAGQRPTEGLGTYEDALESPLLTAQVWEELFAIYEKHISIDFPFLHKRTFLSAVQQQQPPPACFSDVKSPAQSPVTRPYPPLLLAFLTQTARFHEKLVHMGGDPIKTAEFYAQATRTHMGADIFGRPTIEKIQALLMLGYYEWTALQGTEGWIKIGTAIRCAIVLGYTHLDVDLDDDGQPVPIKEVAIKEGDSPLSEKDRFILSEMKRRTFWSCLLMDCYLSWGENRPSMLRQEHHKRTQLPCSDSAFIYGRKARTRLLGEDDATYAKRREDWDRRHREQAGADQAHQSTQRSDAGKWEMTEDEEEITWYIKVVVLFGEVVQWSCNRGRRQEGKVPPFNSASGFWKLDHKLQQHKRDLPENLQLTPGNTTERTYHNPGPYVTIHAIYTMLSFWLYREYMAMSPWALDKPRGPLDEPLIEETPPDPEYWINQAKDCWRACSEFAHLLHSINSARIHNSLAETPMVVFACFNVAIGTTYCQFFPRMDPDSVLSSHTEPRAHDIVRDFLDHFSDRFIMSRKWIYELSQWEGYYHEKKQEYKKHGGQVDSPKSSSSDGDGGLKDYPRFEKIHKQFGDMNPGDSDFRNWPRKDVDVADTRLPHDDDSAERTLPPVSTVVKHEKKVASEHKSDRHSLGAFTPLNSTRPVAGSPSHDARTSPNSQPPIYEAHVNNRLYQPSSSSQYQTQASPPNVSYQQNTSQAQTNMPTHFSVTHPDAQYQNWQSTDQAQRVAIENIGYQTLGNFDTFTGAMLADSGPSGSMFWPMLNYDNGNSTAYYPPPSGPTYQYPQ